MSMTPDELDACRVFLAAYRQIRNGRIEVQKRDHDTVVRIVRWEQVSASAQIHVVAEAR